MVVSEVACELMRSPGQGGLDPIVREQRFGDRRNVRSYGACMPSTNDVLLNGAALVGFVPDPGRPLHQVQAVMARFSDGTDHQRRRAVAVDALRRLDVEAARQRSYDMAARALRSEETVDLAPLARTVPTSVLCELMGLSPAIVVPTIDALCRALAPMGGVVDRPDDEAVMAGLHEAFGDMDEVVVNRLSLLFQAMDATSSLISLEVIRWADARATRRPAVSETRRTVDGETVVVRFEHPGEEFGRGAHACPGQGLAEAMVRGFLDAVRASGRTLTLRVEEISFEDRPNLRVAVALPTRRLAR